MLAPYRGACELAVTRYEKFSGKAVRITRNEPDLDVAVRCRLAPRWPG